MIKEDCNSYVGSQTCRFLSVRNVMTEQSLFCLEESAVSGEPLLDDLLKLELYVYKPLVIRLHKCDKWDGSNYFKIRGLHAQM